MAIRVIYVHHAGVFGGASRSLLEMFNAFPAQSIAGCLVTQRGEVAKLAKTAGMDVLESVGIAQFDHTRYGQYSGRRWLLLLRELAYLGPTIVALIKARYRWPDAALVHLNEVTLLPALLIVKMIFNCPIVVHVRSVQLLNSDSMRSRFLNRQLRRTNAVIAIDQTVRRSLPPDLPCDVVHNGLNISALAKAPRNPLEPLRVGMVGNLLGLKGVHDFVEAARLCKDRGFLAKFIIFGSNTRQHSGITGWLLAVSGFSKDIQRELRETLRRYRLEETVELAGFRSNLNSVYGSMDVLCFPSHLDAPGRPVFEAAFWCVPSIVAVQNPTDDTLQPGETGLTIEAHNPEAIADAVIQLCQNPAEVERLGRNAQKLALKNFDAQTNAQKVLAVYQRVLGNSTS